MNASLRILLYKKKLTASKISTSPSAGQLNGSSGSNQTAGQIPSAEGAESPIVTYPLFRLNLCLLTSRADVYLCSPAAKLLEIARITRVP